MSDKNQDKEKREKQGEPEHDESVLNPERKDELDLSKKERRLIEKEKLKGMGTGKKLEYIWMYYKPVIFGVIAAIALVFGIRDYYEGLKVKTVLSVAVVDSQNGDTDSTAEEIKEQLGYEGDKYSRVEINVNMTSNEDGDGLEYYAQMTYVTQIAAGTMDIMIMPEKVYETLYENNDQSFLNLKELLGEENFQAFGNQTDETHISVTDSELATKFGLSYEPICIVVPASTSEADNAAKWLSVLAEREK